MSDGEYIPEEDFEEVNKEGTLSEDDDEGTVSYATREEDVMEEVRKWYQGKRRSCAAVQDEIVSPSRKEVAKKEKQRLREIERLRKERLESLRKEQNSTTQKGQVDDALFQMCEKE